MGSSSNTAPVIDHTDVAGFAESNVNLPYDKVVEYRARVGSLKSAVGGQNSIR